jgi:hypothetical protein
LGGYEGNDEKWATRRWMVMEPTAQEAHSNPMGLAQHPRNVEQV